MKYLIDSANLDEIRALSEYLPIAGVTSNPSIVKKEGSVPFFAHMREIRSIIGNLRPLHIQVTATDYDGMMRAFMALEAGADCIAPYYNRMEALGVDAASVIGNIAGIIAHYGYETEILAASFKQPAQIDRAILAGAHSVTVAPDVLRGIFAKQVVADAVQAFSDDWTGLYGGKTLAELSDE